MTETLRYSADGRIVDLRSLLDGLLASGQLSERDHGRLVMASRSAEQAAMHPINFIASQQLSDQTKKHKKIDVSCMLQWLSEQSGQPCMRIDPLKIDVAAVSAVMSYAFASRHQILALAVDSDEVVVASAQPWVNSWEADLSHVTSRNIRRVIVDPADIKKYQVEFYTLARSISGASSEAGQAAGLTNLEAMLELGQMKDPDANDEHIVNIVDWLLGYAFNQRASDIHIEPRRERGKVRFRIDGVLHTIYEFPAQVTTAVISRIKILGRLDVAEKRRPQDGRLKTRRPDAGEVELRLSTLPTAFGEKLVMRIFDPTVLNQGFDELGLLKEDLNRWQRLLASPNGIILVTGPTGSGKTTTLYSSLRRLASDEVNLCTIEDPIEMIEPMFNQMQVNANIDLDFATGVRALLRQDPDVIMVGEIRDAETAEMATQAALTGHLMLSTLHTNDAPSAVTRLLEIGVPAYLLRASLNGVMAQRLVRTLCPHCKEQVPVDSLAWTALTAPWRVAPPAHIFTAKGCDECRHTGFRGRQGIYEILVISDQVREHIRSDTDLKKLSEQAMREGMRTLRLSGAQKVAAGLTTIEEVLRVVPPSVDKQ
ncbi:general secretion pathway protein E [Sinobacterium caligoides]|uniref:General secretion pathway protein E n=1 Tax=Sinobacterium caligoides TaxID=933926 RepID=A0A3N2DGA9_9GAMM|nr:general secretion pathway protein E [Sinobacterium caligoides]